MNGTLASSRTPSPAELFAAGRYIDICGHFRQFPPRSAEEWLMIGRARLALGVIEEAIDSFRRGLELSPQSLPLQYATACAQARLGQWQAVEQALAGCIADDAWRVRALGTRAQARVRAGLWHDAAEDYRCLQRNDNLANHHLLGFAACMVELQRWSEAETCLDQILVKDRGSELAWLLKGRCQEGMGRWAEATETYRCGLVQYPESESLSRRLVATGRRPAVRRPQWILQTLAGREMLLVRWSQAQKDDPADYMIAHRIALLTTYGARKLQDIRPKRARSLWPIALANWTLLLENDEWINQFITIRARVYGREVQPEDHDEFRQLLLEEMEELIAVARGDQPQLGKPSLREEFMRELQACRACRELPGAGLSLLHAGRPVCCGPLLLGQLGLADRLAELLPRHGKAAELPKWLPWPDPQNLGDDVSRMRRLFSSLGYAQARLECGDPLGAMESLRWAICPACATTVRTETAYEVAVCREECEDFAIRNPGFASLDDCAGKLKLEAEWLRLQAYVAAALDAIMLAEPDLPALEQYWQAGLHTLGGGTRREALIEHWQELVLKRANVLREAGRASSAIKLLDQAGTSLPTNHSLTSFLALCLTDYGIELANGGDAEAGVAPLCRAVELNPFLKRALHNFVRVLQAAMYRASARGDFAQAESYLDEAERVPAFNHATSPDPELQKLAEATTFARLQLLTDSAGKHFQITEYAAAAERLERARELASQTWSDDENRRSAAEKAEQLQQYIVAVCRKAAEETIEHGDLKNALQWLERAHSADPDNPSITSEIQAVRKELDRKCLS